MSGTTTNYGIPYADSTDDINVYPTLDQTAKGIIDTALDDIATDAAGRIPKSTVTTKGDLLVGTGAGAVTRLPVGSNGSRLEADSGEASGVKWVAASDAWQQLAAVTASSGFSITASGLGGYKYYKVRFKVDTSDNSAVAITINGDTGANYQYTYSDSGGGYHHVLGQTSISLLCMAPASVGYGGFSIEATDPGGLFMLEGHASNYMGFTGHYDPSTALTSITLTVAWPITAASLIVYGKE